LPFARKSQTPLLQAFSILGNWRQGGFFPFQPLSGSKGYKVRKEGHDALTGRHFPNIASLQGITQGLDVG